MFNDTLEEIYRELQWINYELSRQSTNREQEKSLKAKRTALKIIRCLCSDYQNGQYLSRPEFETEEVQNISGGQSPCKAASDAQPSVFQVKSKRSLPPTNIPHREFYFERQADNTLYCKDLDLTLPLTPKGKPDLDQLGREIVSRTGFHSR